MPRLPSLKHATVYNPDNQARNQLGIPRGAKSFLRGAQIFYTISNRFKLRPKHFSRGENF